jgi:hypothetical protein
MRLTDHVALNFNNNMPTAAVFLDIEKTIDTTWHPRLLYKLSKSKFPVNLIWLINSYLSNRKFKLSMPREIKQGCHNFPSWPHLYIGCISITPPKPQGSIWHSSRMTRVFMQQNARRDMFSEICNTASMQWRRDVSAGT